MCLPFPLGGWDCPEALWGRCSTWSQRWGRGHCKRTKITTSTDKEQSQMITMNGLKPTNHMRSSRWGKEQFALRSTWATNSGRTRCQKCSSVYTTTTTRKWKWKVLAIPGVKNVHQFINNNNNKKWKWKVLAVPGVKSVPQFIQQQQQQESESEKF